MRRVGSAQKRALLALVESMGGVGEVPLLSAPGLINRGLVRSLGRAHFKANAAYVCEVTEAGRKLVAELVERNLADKVEVRQNRAQQIRHVG